MEIFLDLDGVMIPGNSWRQPKMQADGFPAFSERAVSALQYLLSETDARIILTTSHKSNYTLETWLELFAVRGLKLDCIARLPENKHRLNRKDELLRYFNTEMPTSPFIIIDDDTSLNDLPVLLKNRLILTNAGIGFTRELANRSIAVLRGEEIVLG